MYVRSVFPSLDVADSPSVTLHLQNLTLSSEHEVANKYGALQAGYMEEELRCPKMKMTH
jgi:hypothetical protein